MHGIELFDHLDTGPAVIGDLKVIRALHQAERDVAVPQAIGRPTPTVAIKLQVQFVKDVVEQGSMVLRKKLVGRTRVIAPL